MTIRPPKILRTHLQTYYGSGHSVSNEHMMFGGGLFSRLGWDEVFLPFELLSDHKHVSKVRDCGPYDVVFTMPFTGIDTWIREVAGPKAVVIGWIPDDAWRFDHTRTLIESRVYDWFVTTAPEAIPFYHGAGHDQVILSNFACRPDSHWLSLLPSVPERLVQATFTGILYGERESRLRAIAASGEVPIEFHSTTSVSVLPPEEYFSMIARSSFSICLTNSSHGVRQMKARLFEPQLFGTVLLTEPMDGLSDWWTPDSECLVFDSPESAQRQMSSLLADPARFDAMSDAAMKRALSDHTYYHRFRHIFQTIGLPVPDFPDFTSVLDDAEIRS